MTPYEFWQSTRFDTVLMESPCDTYEQTDEDGEKWFETQEELKMMEDD